MSLGFQNKILPILENTYNKFISLCLRGKNSLVTLSLTFAMLIGAFMLFGAFMPKMTFFPEADPLYVNIFVDLPIGSDIEATNKTMKELEVKVSKVIEPYGDVIEAVLTQIGENTSDPNSPPEPGVTPNKARMTVQFVEYKDRGEISTRDIMEKIREEIKGSPGVQIVVDQNAGGPPAGKPINIEVKGDKIDSLLVYTADIVNYINDQNIGGIEELKLDVELGKPELLININREAARKYGISTAQIASTLRTSVFGTEASKFKVGEDEYPIVLRLDERYRNNISDLINQKLTFRDQSTGRIVQVPISSVATFQYSSTYNAIRRVDSQRVITISSNVTEGYNANEINAELNTLMEDYPFQEGYTFEFTGEQQQQAEDMAFLGGAFLAAVFFIFIILVTQFNSLITPFIIILSVLFSLIGVLLGYVITGKEFNILFSGVGVISLAGIVVNNAIVLVDYVNLLIKRKSKEKGVESMFDLEKHEVMDSVIEGGATRLRPVLLTAITTVLGLIPLAIGFNFNFFTFVERFDPQFFIGGDNTAMWGPMAWTIIYGIIFATFLTLIVVPAMYWLAYRVKARVKTRIARK
jgi:multidrug efflux pump subunit AcrB